MTYTKGVIHMLMPLGVYMRRGQRFFRTLQSDPRLKPILHSLLWAASGMVLSAASLSHTPLPLCLGLLCSGVSGWSAVFLALGSGLGYPLFWGSAGAVGQVWTAGGLLLSLILGNRRLSRPMPALLPALSGLTVALTGLMFRFWQPAEGHFLLYLLQILTAIVSAWVFEGLRCRRGPVTDWLSCGLVVLALAQIGFFPGATLGVIAIGALSAAAPFPAAVLAGMALDLSQTLRVPFTAVACLSFFLRFIPTLPKWAAKIAPTAIYLLLAPLFGGISLPTALCLTLGGLASSLLPAPTPVSHRRGVTGVAQVRLELASSVLAQSEQLLLEVQPVPIDEAALVLRATERACIACPCRKTCKEQEQAAHMPVTLLHKPLVSVEDIPLLCRKRGRMLSELRRSQEQYRSIKADRDRQREYRSALTQQLHFLSSYLQDLSDTLPRHAQPKSRRFDVEIGFRSARTQQVGGDGCSWFSGPNCQYYVVLCDGMGTGMGAKEESRTALQLLRRLLSAGYPPEHALRSLNSLCTLRERAGAVTVDLAQIDLCTGKAAVYKWGAAPSYLLSQAGTIKIGTAGPPPGLSVTNARETVDKLSLRRGETLILLSDGVDGEAVTRQGAVLAQASPGELAAGVLEYGRGNGQDDATAVAIRLRSCDLST